jgi:hypothetical protein
MVTAIYTATIKDLEIGHKNYVSDVAIATMIHGF